MGHADDFDFNRRIPRCLYLPITRDKKYFNKLGAKQNEKMYLRIHDLPLSLRQSIPKIFKNKINKEPVIIVSSYCVRLKEHLSDYLPSLEDLKTWYSKNTVRRTKIDEWIQLILETQESWSMDNPSTARLIYFSAFIMSFAHSELVAKQDLCIV